MCPQKPQLLWIWEMNSDSRFCHKKCTNFLTPYWWISDNWRCISYQRFYLPSAWTQILYCKNNQGVSKASNWLTELTSLFVIFEYYNETKKQLLLAHNKCNNLQIYLYCSVINDAALIFKFTILKKVQVFDTPQVINSFKVESDATLLPSWFNW